MTEWNRVLPHLTEMSSPGMFQKQRRFRNAPEGGERGPFCSFPPFSKRKTPGDKFTVTDFMTTFTTLLPWTQAELSDWYYTGFVHEQEFIGEFLVSGYAFVCALAAQRKWISLAQRFLKLINGCEQYINWLQILSLQWSFGSEDWGGRVKCLILRWRSFGHVLDHLSCREVQPQPGTPKKVPSASGGKTASTSQTLHPTYHSF